MLDQEHSNPAYDSTMEVLCLLPKFPYYAPLEHIADDLRFEGNGQVRIALRELARKGIELDMRRSLDGQAGYFVAIGPLHWTRATWMAEKYLEDLEKFSAFAAAVETN